MSTYTEDTPAPALEHVALDRYLPLRWIALAGHVAALSAAWMLGFRLDLPLVAGLIAIEVGAALLLVAHRDRLHTRPSESLVALMLLDAVLLVALLYLTGGPHNPLSVVLTVNVAIAAYLLPTRRALAVTAALLGLSALLFVDSRPLESRNNEAAALDPCCEACEASGPAPAAPATEPCCDQCAAATASAAGAAQSDVRVQEHTSGGHGALSMALHLQGMWVGYLVVGAAILAFMARLRADVSHRDRALRRAEAAREVAERRAALATLAAGAAHELATPLATVSLASEALVEHLERQQDAADDSIEDAKTIREQVARCRAILDRMAFELGHPAGQVPRATRLGDLIADACAGLDPSRVRIEAGDLIDTVRIPTVGSVTAQALHNVVDNALRADPGVVDLVVRLVGAQVELIVRDRGVGMSAEQLNRAGEPFFTSREPGEGMGLGLFVARAAVEELGGELRIVSEPGVGTEVTLVLPRMERA